MSSYVSLFIHVTFATRNRTPLLTREIRERLFPYLIKTAPHYGAEVACIGGIEDHIHLLFILNPTESLSKSVQSLKGVSSKWMNETFLFPQPFRWQEGYSGFSVSISLVPKTKEYILGQEEHHRKKHLRRSWKNFENARNGIERTG